MAQSQAQEFMDTVQLVPGEQGTPNAITNPASAACASDSANTQALAADDSDIWPEAADFQCSQSAALFAGTLPAPLTVV